MTTSCTKLLASDADKLKRTHYKPEDNKTSSETDPVFLQFREKKLTAAEKTKLADWNFRLDQSKDVIAVHLDKRVNLLFMQAVVCYQTKYTFREGKTILQGLQAESLKGKEKYMFNAAHSATLPSLYAKEEGGGEFVYLYGSQYYDESNSTIDVIRQINEADRAIDEKYSISTLRKDSVDILNKVSVGLLTPHEAIVEFTSLLVKQIKVSIKKETDRQVVDVLNLYLTKANQLNLDVQDSKNIDDMLNLQMDNPILKQATEAISLAQNVNCNKEDVIRLIKFKIDELPVIIREKAHRLQNISRAPNHFYDLFKYELLKKCVGNQLPIIEQSIGTNYKTLKSRVKDLKKTGTSKSLLSAGIKKIDALAKEVLSLASKIDGDDPTLDEGLSKFKAVYLRPSIYKLRYQMILSDQQIQSEIKSKIEQVYNQIKGGKRAPANLEAFYVESLLSNPINAHLKKMICKLLNISKTKLDQKLREIKVNARNHSALESQTSNIINICELLREFIKDPSDNNKQRFEHKIDLCNQTIKSTHYNDYTDLLFYRRIFDYVENDQELIAFENILNRKLTDLNKLITEASKIKAAENKLDGQNIHIDSLADFVKTKIFSLREKSKKFRRKLFVELRLSHGMSQDVFKAKYKELFPNHPMSDGTLSNYENGKKELSTKFIEQASEIFGVQSSLFYPESFAE